MKSEIAKKLLQIKAIKLSSQNPFTWASGIKSPIYCDNRIALSFPAVRTLIVKALVQQAQEFSTFDKIAGVATAGIPWGVLLAEALELPFIYVRSKAKAHGRQNLIEGVYRATERILLIEDLISTGGSSYKAVQALQAVDCRVIGVLAIFSYNFNQAIELFKAAQLPFDTLSNYDVLIEEAIEEGYIEEEALKALKNWQQAPEIWKK